VVERLKDTSETRSLQALEQNQALAGINNSLTIIILYLLLPELSEKYPKIGRNNRYEREKEQGNHKEKA
jgi:hypothetical protein